MANIILGLVGFSFTGVGFFLIFRAWQVLCSSAPSLIGLLMFWGTGAMFSGIGGLFLIFGIFGQSVKPGDPSPLAERKRQLGILSPQEEWSAGRISSQGRSQLIFNWLGMLPAVVIAAPVLWIGVSHGILSHQDTYLWWLLAAMIPLGQLVKASYLTLAWRKYGTVICEIQHKPDASDGELRCLIREERSALPAAEMVVRLRCEKREYVGVGKERNLRISPQWEDQKIVAISPPRFWAQASFTIPPELPEARHTMSEGIFWILVAHMNTPGVDFNAQFDLMLQRSTDKV